MKWDQTVSVLHCLGELLLNILLFAFCPLLLIDWLVPACCPNGFLHEYLLYLYIHMICSFLIGQTFNSSDVSIDICLTLFLRSAFAQSAGAVEYADCFSAEG